MKRKITLALCVLLIVGSSLMTVSCSQKNEDKKSDETEYVGNPEYEGTFDGVWVDKSGVFMTIDLKENTLTDSCGWEFTIDEVTDDGLILTWNPINEKSLFYTYEVNPRNSIVYSLPLYHTFYFPMTLDGETLKFGDVTLYKSTSSEGKKYKDAKRPNTGINYIKWDRNNDSMAVVLLNDEDDLKAYGPSDREFEVSLEDGMGAVTTDELCDHFYGDVVDFIRADSVLGQMMLYRDEVVNNKFQDIYNLQGLSFEDNDVVITIDYEIDKGEWIPDIFDVRYYSLKERDNLDYDEFAESVGPEVNVYTFDDDVEYTITVTVPTDKVEEPDRVTLFDTFSYGSGGHHSIATVSNKVENDVLTIVVEGGSGIGFCVGYDTRPTTYYEINDVKNILNTDPEDSLWAATCDTGDIIRLVDMDYLEDSIIDEDGTAIFWVSTPEQLATATYYVNSLDVLDDNIKTMFYIHLLNDIDLDGYAWVPMGHRENEREIDGHLTSHYFQGAIFGNGYAIKNLTISGFRGSGLLSSCHLTTVSGLTLENPKIEADSMGFVFAFIDDYSCISDVIDCKLVTDNKDAEIYDFADYDNKSLVYIDCLLVVHQGGDKSQLVPLNDEFNHDFYNGYSNWIMRYYWDETSNTYVYDVQKEYEDFCADSSHFLDCSYYYAEGDEFGEDFTGYLNFTGWLYNNEFMVNYGNIRMPND